MRVCVKCECPIVASRAGRISKKCPGCGSPWLTSTSHAVERPNPPPFVLIGAETWRCVVYWDEEDERPRIGVETTHGGRDLLGGINWVREELTPTHKKILERVARLVHEGHGHVEGSRTLPAWAHAVWQLDTVEETDDAGR